MSGDLLKVLFCSFDVLPEPTGSSARATEFLRGLTPVFNVDALTLKSADHGHIERYYGARLMRVPAGSGDLPTKVQAFERAVRRQLESDEYQLVHFTDPYGGYALCELRAQYNFKLVYEVVGFPSVEVKYTHPHLEGDRRFMAKLRRQELFCLMNADAVLVGSETTAKAVHGLGVARERITVIPACVDPALYPPLHELPKPDRTPMRIIYLGNQQAWQGLATLLFALSIAARSCDVRLSLYGPQHPSWKLQLEEMVKYRKLTDRVEFHDAVPPEELGKVLAAADVGVAPLEKSERNTVQGAAVNKIAHYLAAGRPVVVADLPIVRELVSEECAVFHKAGDENDLARKLIELANDPARRLALGERAYSFAREKLSADQGRAALLKLYVGLLGPAAAEILAEEIPLKAERIPPDVLAEMKAAEEAAAAEAAAAEAGGHEPDSAQAAVQPDEPRQEAEEPEEPAAASSPGPSAEPADAPASEPKKEEEAPKVVVDLPSIIVAGLDVEVQVIPPPSEKAETRKKKEVEPEIVGSKLELRPAASPYLPLKPAANPYRPLEKKKESAAPPAAAKEPLPPVETAAPVPPMEAAPGEPQPSDKEKTDPKVRAPGLEAGAEPAAEDETDPRAKSPAPVARDEEPAPEARAKDESALAEAAREDRTDPRAQVPPPAEKEKTEPKVRLEDLVPAADKTDPKASLEALDAAHAASTDPKVRLEDLVPPSDKTDPKVRLEDAFEKPPEKTASKVSLEDALPGAERSDPGAKVATDPSLPAVADPEEPEARPEPAAKVESRQAKEKKRRGKAAGHDGESKPAGKHEPKKKGKGRADASEPDTKPGIKLEQVAAQTERPAPAGSPMAAAIEAKLGEVQAKETDAPAKAAAAAPPPAQEPDASAVSFDSWAPEYFAAPAPAAQPTPLGAAAAVTGKHHALDAETGKWEGEKESAPAPGANRALDSVTMKWGEPGRPSLDPDAHPAAAAPAKDRALHSVTMQWGKPNLAQPSVAPPAPAPGRNRALDSVTVKWGDPSAASVSLSQPGAAPAPAAQPVRNRALDSVTMKWGDPSAASVSIAQPDAAPAPAQEPVRNRALDSVTMKWGEAPSQPLAEPPPPEEPEHSPWEEKTRAGDEEDVRRRERVARRKAKMRIDDRPTRVIVTPSPDDYREQEYADALAEVSQQVPQAPPQPAPEPAASRPRPPPPPARPMEELLAQTPLAAPLPKTAEPPNRPSARPPPPPARPMEELITQAPVAPRPAPRAASPAKPVDDWMAWPPPKPSSPPRPPPRAEAPVAAPKAADAAKDPAPKVSATPEPPRKAEPHPIEAHAEGPADLATSTPPSGQPPADEWLGHATHGYSPFGVQVPRRTASGEIPLRIRPPGRDR